MPDEDNNKNDEALVKPPIYAVHKVSPGLVHRAIQDIDRLININPVNLVMYYPEIGAPKSIELILKREGYLDVKFKFKWFEKIEGFLDWIYNHDFDLILIDPYRLVVGGKRVCDFNIVRQIRNDFPNCRIIVITGYLTPSNAEEAIRQGANDFIVLPFSVDDILTIFKNEFLIINKKRKRF